MRIKLVVRVRDIGGVLTAKVLDTRAKEVEFDEYLNYEFQESKTASFVKKWWMARRRKKLGQKSRDARAQLLKVALHSVEAAVKNQDAIGIEQYPGAPFRSVKHNERIELREGVSKAHAVWVFIFEPNELLADSNKMFAWVA